MSGEVRRSWTTSGKVRRVGPRTGRFVEAYDIPKAMVEYVHVVIKCDGLI